MKLLSRSLVLLLLTPLGVHSQNTRAMRVDTVFTFAEQVLLAEDMAFDPVTRRFLIGSLRKKKVVWVDSTGRGGDFFGPAADVWAVPALALDLSRRILWIGTASSPVMEGSNPASTGRSSLIALSLTDGRFLKRIEPPADGRPHFFGDIALAPSGDLYISDAGTSAVYQLRRGEDSLRVFVAPGQLRGPQSPAPSRDGRTIYVPDYARGIAVVDRSTQHIAWMAKPDSLDLSGIDVLYACGRGLLAVQNGTTPKRVLWIELVPGAHRVRTWRVLASGPDLDEPTHGTVVGRSFFLLSNVQAYRYHTAAPGTTPATDRQVVVKLNVPC